MKYYLPLIAAIITTSVGLSQTNVSLNFLDSSAISPFIYGFNQDHETPGDNEKWTIRRLGGNRLSVFNWENGASNSGADNPNYTNDNRIPSLVGVTWNDKDKIGETYSKFINDNNNNNIESIITLPLIGWVAADKNGANTTSPPSSRWHEVIAKKNTPFSLTPDLTDGKIYLDESVNFLINKFGNSSQKGGIKYISLGNEPGLWSHTHPNLQPSKIGVKAYTDKVIEAAKAIKALDPNIKIIVGEFAGINLYNLKSAPDWTTEGQGYDWFISYFLDQLKKASDIEKTPLVDIISIHNYPQHKIDINGNFSSNGTSVRTNKSIESHIRNARMNFARSMWDSTYIEPSWLTNSYLKGSEPNMILKRIKHSINQYYPDVQLMIGEYDYSFVTDISHGIATADALGVFARENISIVNRWNTELNSTPNYTSSAYNLFRNYDGLNGKYGSTNIPTNFNNRELASVWASINSNQDELHLIILNKDQQNNQTFVIALNDPNFNYTNVRVFGFNETSMNISQKTVNTNLDNTALTITLPKLSAFHVIVERTSLLNSFLEKSNNNIIISPNPAKDIITFDNEYNYSISTLSGQVLVNGKDSNVNVSNLKKGIYLIKLDGDFYRFVKD